MPFLTKAKFGTDTYKRNVKLTRDRLVMRTASAMRRLQNFGNKGHDLVNGDIDSAVSKLELGGDYTKLKPGAVTDEEITSVLVLLQMLLNNSGRKGARAGIQYPQPVAPATVPTAEQTATKAKQAQERELAKQREAEKKQQQEIAKQVAAIAKAEADLAKQTADLSRQQTALVALRKTDASDGPTIVAGVNDVVTLRENLTRLVDESDAPRAIYYKQDVPLDRLIAAAVANGDDVPDTETLSVLSEVGKARAVFTSLIANIGPKSSAAGEQERKRAADELALLQKKGDAERAKASGSSTTSAKGGGNIVTAKPPRTRIVKASNAEHGLKAAEKRRAAALAARASLVIEPPATPPTRIVIEDDDDDEDEEEEPADGASEDEEEEEEEDESLSADGFEADAALRREWAEDFEGELPPAEDSYGEDGDVDELD